MLDPLSTIDWPTIVAFVIIEVGIVLMLAPLVIQRRNEARAVHVFETHLLPRIRTSTKELVDQLRAELLAARPTEEQQALARDELVAAIVPHVQATVQEATDKLAGGAAARFSQSGVSARREKASLEFEFKQAVAQHPKGGLPAVLSLAALKKADKEFFELAMEAYALKPDSLTEFLEKHGSKLTLGFGGGNTSKTEGSRVVRM